MKNQIAPRSPIAHVPADTQDRWLERSTKHRSSLQEIWFAYIDYPRRWAIQFFRFLTTTPGKMTAMVTILSILILITGISLSQLTSDRQARFDRLLTNTEPVSYLTQDLYSSLSLANTAASSGFVLSGSESFAAHTEFARAYQQAGRDISLAAGGIADNTSEEMTLVTDLSQKLPIYTGLVETAWTNNHQGNPVGVAYMSEASTLMREELLPTASKLYTLTNANVETQQRQLTTPQYFPIIGLAVTLTSLIIAQFWMAATTNRRLNRGMLVATALLTIITSWVVTADILTWSAGARAVTNAATPLESLTNARIMAQQARTQELLALVWRQSLVNSSNTFDATTTSIKETLTDFSGPQADTATTALNNWITAHNEILGALNVGDYETAQTLALRSSTSDAYTELDTALARLIDDSRTTLRGYITTAINASGAITTMSLVLSILAVLSIWAGIRPRIQEYL